MIGELNWNHRKATIVGAGISGLLIGYRLKKLGFEVQILESSNRVGGLIQTTIDKNGLVEHAAHSLLVGPVQDVFFKELGIELLTVSPQSKARYIVRNSKMRRMPLSFFEFIVTIICIFKKHSPNTSEINLEQWGNQYIGKAATQFLLTPFISGIFACRPFELDPKIAFPELPLSGSLFQWMRKPRIRSQMMTPKRGLQSVTDALYKELKNEVQLNTTVETIPAVENLILTTPTLSCSKLIGQMDLDSSNLLTEVPYSPLISVGIFIRKTEFEKLPSGVGVLAPAGQGIQILGVLFNSSSFPERSDSELVSITCMLGGTGNPEALNLTDKEIMNICIQDLKLILNLKSDLIESYKIHRWKRAIPVYGPKLVQTLNSLRKGFCKQPGRVIFANWTGEVSIRKMIQTVCDIHPPEGA